MVVLPKFLSREDDIVYSTGLHWIYLVRALLWLGFIIFLGVIAEHYLTLYTGNLSGNFGFTILGYHFNMMHPPIILLSIFAGLVIFFPYLIIYFTTHIYLSKTKIFRKSGLFSQDITEIDLEEIKGEEIHKGVLGHILRYGDVHLDCRFIGDIVFSSLNRPDIFIRALNIERKKLLTSCPEDQGDKNNHKIRDSVNL